MGSEVQKRRKRMQPPPARYQAFMDGDLTVDDLDDEEVQRMQLRASDGSFRGGIPHALPREFLNAIRMEQQKRFAHWVNTVIPEAQKTVVELMQSKKLQPGDATRLKAAQEILERFAGKTPERVEVKAEVSVFEQTLSDIIVDFDSEDDE